MIRKKTFTDNGTLMLNTVLLSSAENSALLMRSWVHARTLEMTDGYSVLAFRE